MRRLLRDNHEDRRRAARGTSAGPSRIYRALLAAGVVERLDRARRGRPHGPAHRRPAARTSRSTSRCRRSPSAALDLLDPESPTYALDVRLGHRGHARGPAAGARRRSSSRRAARRSRQMKADGIEYDERMELLEEVDLPEAAAPSCSSTPTRSTAQGHPWVADHALSPKSVVRDMYERAMTFAEYVALLRPRPLRGAGAALPRRRLPGAAADRARRRRAPRSSTTSSSGSASWCGRSTPACSTSGSSCATRADDADAARRADATPPAVTANARAFRVLVRNALFRRVELAALRRYDELGELDGEAGWDAEAGQDALDGVLRRARRASAPARTPAARRMLLIDERPRTAGRCGRSSTTRRRPRLGHHRRGRPGRVRRRRHRRVRVTDVGPLSEA